MGHCAAGDSGESSTLHAVILPITQHILSTIHSLLNSQTSWGKIGIKSHICPHSCICILYLMRIWPVGDWPALPSQLATGLLSSPEQSHFYIFVSNMKTETLTRQDVNQWQGDKDLEQEPDADHPRLRNNAVCGQTCYVWRQETGQTVTQWYAGPQVWCWEIRSPGHCHPDCWWRVTSPQHTWHLYCNMQTPDITTLYIHNSLCSD